MTPIEEAAAKLLAEAIKSFKERARDEAMALPALPENDDERRALVMKFHIADDVGKTISAQKLR